MRPKVFYSGKHITAKEADTLAAKLAKPSLTSETSIDEEKHNQKKLQCQRVKKRREEERSRHYSLSSITSKRL